MFDKPMLRPDVLESLRTSTTLSEPVRRQALLWIKKPERATDEDYRAFLGEADALEFDLIFPADPFAQPAKTRDDRPRRAESGTSIRKRHNTEFAFLSHAKNDVARRSLVEARSS